MLVIRTSRLSQPRTYVVFIALTATLLGFFMLTRDNSWGDDFAGYILQAKSIVDGNMDVVIARNTFTIVNSSHNINPANYPWGFPLMLAPVYAIFGVKVLAFKFVQLLCHTLLVLVCFFLAKTRLSDIDAVIVAAVVGYNRVLLAEGVGDILSDIPFTLFSLAGLLMIVLPVPASRRGLLGRGILTGLLMFLAVFVRMNGLLLLIPLLIVNGPVFLKDGGQGRTPAALAILVPGLVFGLLYVLQAAVFPHSTLRNIHFSLAPRDLWAMAEYYYRLPANFLIDLGPAAHAVYLIQLGLLAASILVHGRRDFPFHAYMGATMAMYIAFPYGQGARYIYPLWPIFLIFTFDGLHVIADRLNSPLSRGLVIIFRLLCCGLVGASLVACLSIARNNMLRDRYTLTADSGPFSFAATQMFDYIDDHTPPDSVIVFFKPRAMRLRTNRDSFVATECSYLSAGDYLVTAKGAGSYEQIDPKRLSSCDRNVLLTPVFERDLFIGYRIQPRK